MTLDELRQSLAATEPPAELTPALVGLWWDGKGDGNERMGLPNRTKASRDRECMRTCTARKAIRTTRDIGIVVLASPFAGSRWIRNRRAS